MHVIVNTDGACRGNPGPSSAGWVIRDETGKVVEARGVALGRGTNNEAEYKAVVLGLNAALQCGATSVELRSDSELLIKQLKGEYRVKNTRLKPLYEQVRASLLRFERSMLQHVRRELNREADAEANAALDDLS